MQGICGTPPTLFTTVAAKLSSAVLSYERATPHLTIPPLPLRKRSIIECCSTKIVSLLLSKTVREGTNFFFSS